VAVVTVVGGIWLAWPPAPRTVLERGVRDTPRDWAADYGELSDLDGVCPPVLSGADSEATLHVVTITQLSHDLPSGFVEVTLADERNSRNMPGGVLDTAKAGTARTETRLYSRGDWSTSEDFFSVSATHGSQEGLCTMLRWSAVQPQQGTAGTAAWRAQHDSLEPPTSAPSQRPEHPAAKIVSLAGRTVLLFDEPGKPHRSAAWLQDDNLVVEVVVEGLDDTELEVIVATTRRSD
jgi:hypothetical protein